MQEESSNYLGFGMFFLFIVLIVFVGSALLFWNVYKAKNDKVILDNNDVIISDKNKKDKDKDFIYFTDEETISENLSIVNKYPIINLNSNDAKSITNEIKEYVDTIKSTLQKLDSVSVTCDYGEFDNIYKTRFLDYGIYSYQEYITLLIRESEYNCVDGISASSKVKSYTFNVLTGERLEFNELLLKYNTTLTNVIEKVRKNLQENQTIIDEIPTIQIEETINALKEQETFVIYLDEFGDLNINYVVKTSGVDYNDTITING